MNADRRRHAPAALRNREPIAAVLREILPENGRVLEIASGTGEHAVHFAKIFTQLQWQPSDPDLAARASIAAHVGESEAQNISPPLDLDAALAEWPIDEAAAVLCINMIHISPWQATIGLLAGAGRILPAGAPLYLYGPFRRAGVPTAPSNEAFDESLRARNADWGLRDLETVAAAAAPAGLTLDRIVEMPANNLSAILRKNRHSR